MNNPICILILEDNPSDFELVKRELRSAISDYTVEWAPDKETFLQAVDKFVPDLILLDYSLPGFDGLSALALARQRFPDIPAIIVSGAIGEEVAIEALKAGATDYVLKQRLNRLGPVTRRALQEAKQLTERKWAEEALRASEERYRSLFSSMTEGFALHEIVYDDDGQPCDYRFLEINPAFERLTGLKRDDVIGHTHNQIMPDDDPKWLQEYGKVAMTGNAVHFENYSPALKRYYEVHAYRPAPQLFAVLFMDITERKLAEECLRASLAEKEVLLKEIHHRVKNNMQVISSLIGIQANSPADPAVIRILEDLRGRVRTMALVHEKLYLSRDISRIDFAEYARSLLRFIWQANATDAARVELRLDMQPLLLSVEAAVPCGLILNELATNALKHAFRGRDKGVVNVALHKGDDGRSCLMVSDNGIGLPADLDWRQSPTLGLQLVNMLARQLGGTVEVEVHKGEGTEFRITFGADEDWS